jgi:hypothetical protein
MQDADHLENWPSVRGQAGVSVESALRRIVEIANDRSMTEKRVRTQVWAYARAALAQIEIAKLTGTNVLAEVAQELPIAWLHDWSGRDNEISTDLVDDRYGLAAAIPLSFEENGDILGWRWADGGGYNADYRYSLVDPQENWDEVEAQGASSVISCRPLYRHLLFKEYRV